MGFSSLNLQQVHTSKIAIQEIGTFWVHPNLSFSNSWRLFVGCGHCLNFISGTVHSMARQDEML
jgi:hypothetical protein